jgi:hypothetical protein
MLVSIALYRLWVNWKKKNNTTSVRYQFCCEFRQLPFAFAGLFSNAEKQNFALSFSLSRIARHRPFMLLSTWYIQWTFAFRGDTWRFIMFSVITNIYNKKTKGLTLMESFTVTENWKKKKYFWQIEMFDVCLKARIIAAVKNVDAPMLTSMWQELEYRIDVCRVTRVAHIDHL